MPTLFTEEELENMAKTFNLPAYKPVTNAALVKIVRDYELSFNVNTILQSYIVIKKHGSIF